MNSGSLWRHRLLLAAFPSALILGTWGYLGYADGSEHVSFSNALYHAAQLFILHAPHFGTPVPWQLELGRWLAMVATGLVLFDTARLILVGERKNRALGRADRHAIV